MLSHALRARATLQRQQSFTISFVSSATNGVAGTNGTSTSVTLPSTIQANDILVIFCNVIDSNSSTPPSITTPSGYTLVNVQGSYNIPQADTESVGTYYKIAVSGDASSTLTISSGNGNYRSVTAIVFRTTKGSSPNISIASLNSYGSAVTSGSAPSPPNQTVTSGTGSAPLIVLASYVTLSTRTFTPTEDGEIASFNAGRYMRYRIYNSSPVDTLVGEVNNLTVTTLKSFYMGVS